MYCLKAVHLSKDRAFERLLTQNLIIFSSFILLIACIGVSIILIMGDRHMIIHFHARNKNDRYVLLEDYLIFSELTISRVFPDYSKHSLTHLLTYTTAFAGCYLRSMNTVFDTCVSFTFFSETLILRPFNNVDSLLVLFTVKRCYCLRLSLFMFSCCFNCFLFSQYYCNS